MCPWLLSWWGWLSAVGHFCLQHGSKVGFQFLSEESLNGWGGRLEGWCEDPCHHWLAWKSPSAFPNSLACLALSAFWLFFGYFPCIHCVHDCLGHEAFEVFFSWFSQPNSLLLRFQTVMWEVALVTAIIAGVHFGFESTMVNVHGYWGVQIWGSSQGLHLGDIQTKQVDGLLYFSKSPMKAV